MFWRLLYRFYFKKVIALFSYSSINKKKIELYLSPNPIGTFVLLKVQKHET